MKVDRNNQQRHLTGFPFLTSQQQRKNRGIFCPNGPISQIEKIVLYTKWALDWLFCQGKNITEYDTHNGRHPIKNDWKDKTNINDGIQKKT
jgi:predicted AAA+ superfamily ATPase